MISAGDLGQVLTVAADENLDTGLTNFFLRSDWRRWDKFTGGFLVEKCCHDLDILNWLVDSPVARIQSVARRTHFVKDPPGGRLERLDQDTPMDPRIDYGDEKLNKLIEHRHFGSLYETEDDLPDHQTTMLEFENGVLATFNAVFAQPYCTRRIKVFGANGYVEGDAYRSKIIHEFFTEDGTPDSREILIQTDGSGHHGGNAGTSEDFWRHVAGDGCPIRAGLEAGIEAVVVAAAGEEAKRTGQPVELAALRRRAFGG